MVIADQLNFDQGAFLVVAVIGTIAFATSGVIAAAEAGHDWLGAAVLAVVVATGGGTIRDILIGNLPVTWVRDEWPVEVALVTVAGLAGAVLHVVLYESGSGEELQVWVPVVVVVAVRALAIRFDLHLPRASRK